MGYPTDPNDWVQEAFDDMPDRWFLNDTESEWIETLTEALFDAPSWDEAHEYYDLLHDYIMEHFNEDLDDFFDWDNWREHYDAA